MEKFSYTVVNNIYFIPPTYKIHKFVNKLITKTNKIVKYSTFETAYNNHDDFDGIIDDVKIIDEKIITITYWPPCYGHLFESLFNLYSFYNNNETYNGYKILVAVPYNSKNIIDLANYLFKDMFINSYDLSQITEFKEVVLVYNHTNYDCFFKFDNEYVKQHIRNYYQINNSEQYENVFLTRSINGPHDRNSVLSNLDYIINFFIINNFKIIDPQHISDKELYNHIKNSKNIITTNGSALCPLIVLNNPNVKVFCLNSSRYLPEWRRNCKDENEVICNQHINNNINDNFEKNLWKHVTSKFNFTYIDSYKNVITNEQLDYIIKNINL
jgi:hypothetical protein